MYVWLCVCVHLNAYIIIRSRRCCWFGSCRCTPAVVRKLLIIKLRLQYAPVHSLAKLIYTKSTGVGLPPTHIHLTTAHMHHIHTYKIFWFLFHCCCCAADRPAPPPRFIRRHTAANLYYIASVAIFCSIKLGLFLCVFSEQHGSCFVCHSSGRCWSFVAIFNWIVRLVVCNYACRQWKCLIITHLGIN